MRDAAGATTQRHPVPHASWLARARYRRGPSPGRLILAGCLVVTAVGTGWYVHRVYRQQEQLATGVYRTLTVVADPLGPSGQPTAPAGNCWLTLRAAGLSRELRHVDGPCYLTPGARLQGWVAADRHVSWDRPPNYTRRVGRTVVSGVFAALVTFGVSGVAGLLVFLAIQRRRYGT